MTAAFVAQYGAACDHAVRPATEAVRMIDPDRCGRMTATAARMPLTAPITLMRKARSQSSVVRLWMRPFGRQHARVAHEHVEAAEPLDGQGDHALDVREVAHVGDTVATGGGASARPATVAASEDSDRSLSTRAVSGSPARRRDDRRPQRAAGAGDGDHSLCEAVAGHTRR